MVCFRYIIVNAPHKGDINVIVVVVAVVVVMIIVSSKNYKL
jgi:hypothetical protein